MGNIQYFTKLISKIKDRYTLEKLLWDANGTLPISNLSIKFLKEHFIKPVATHCQDKWVDYTFSKDGRIMQDRYENGIDDISQLSQHTFTRLDQLNDVVSNLVLSCIYNIANFCEVNDGFFTKICDRTGKRHSLAHLPIFDIINAQSDVDSFIDWLYYDMPNIQEFQRTLMSDLPCGREDELRNNISAALEHELAVYNYVISLLREHYSLSDDVQILCGIFSWMLHLLYDVMLGRPSAREFRELSFMILDLFDADDEDDFSLNLLLAREG